MRKKGITGIVATTILTFAVSMNAAGEVPLTGNGTADSPYLVTSVADWNAMAEYIKTNGDNFAGKYVSMTADLDFKSVAFTPVSGFGGTFDGASHAMRNVEYTTTATYQGMFGTIEADATVRNLTVAGTISTGFEYTGGIAGLLKGKIESCKSAVNITSTVNYTGGVLGKADNNSTINQCTYEGELQSGKYYLGGIVADCGSGVTVSGCVNKGVVHNTTSMTGALDVYVGGIAARALPSTFTDCVNEGEIIIDSPKFGTCVAGILAYANNVANAEKTLFSFRKCRNTSYINAAYNLAGILADINYSRTIALVLEFTECVNEGNIISSGAQKSNIAMGGISCYYSPTSTFTGCSNSGILQSDNNPYVGGIVGRYKVIADMNPKETMIEKCYNTGKIIASKGTGAGIMGQAHKSVTFNGCYNEGEITGKSTIGGIVGIMASGSKILNCRNSGNVTVSEGSAAGIIPSNATQCEINCCVNTGNITSLSADKAKDMGGIAGSGASIFTNCVNIGNVEGYSTIGGIVGSPSKGKTSFINCYNAGNVKYNEGMGGPIVGVDIATSTYWDAETNKTEGCRYVSNFLTKGVNQPGTALSMAEMTALQPGEGWYCAGTGCLPVPEAFKNVDAVTVATVAVIPQNNEKYNSLTSDVTLGMCENVVWTSSANDVISISGNSGKLVELNNVTPVVLTATMGNYKREWNVTNALASGVTLTVEDNAGEAAVYDAAGIRTDMKSLKKGRIYIMVDGNGKTRRFIAR